MRYFITGGAGFIGSHLAERLVRDGHSVSILDDLSTGDLANVESLVGQGAFSYEIGTVTDAEAVARLMDRADVTVHLAAAVGVRLVTERPVHTIETNVGGTSVVLRAAAERNQPVFVASTSEVYGKSAKEAFGEEDDLVLGATAHSRWSYAGSKALDEWLALGYAAERGLPVIVARFFNTVGPRQTGRYGMVLPNFAQQALRGEPITVYGSGDQTRCFAHVADVVEAVCRLLNAPAARGQVFNIGTEQEVSIFALAERVKAAAGSRSPIVRIPYDEAYPKGFEDMMRRKPSVEKLHRVIGFRPETKLDRIVEDVVTDQRRRLEGKPSGAAR
ncbi:MAG: NAD-dependent epimerase/dehydratase family protein [Candidatus Eiseniibacteriota bacterium]